MRMGVVLLAKIKKWPVWLVAISQTTSTMAIQWHFTKLGRQLTGIGVGGVLKQCNVRSFAYIRSNMRCRNLNVCSGSYYDGPVLYAADQSGRRCSARRVQFKNCTACVPENIWETTHSIMCEVCVRSDQSALRACSSKSQREWSKNTWESWASNQRTSGPTGCIVRMQQLQLAAAIKLAHTHQTPM